MADLKFNGVTPSGVTYKDIDTIPFRPPISRTTDINMINFNGVNVWFKTGTLSISIGTGSTLTVRRNSSNNPDASIGTLSNGASIYWGDSLTFTYGAQTGYRNPSMTLNGTAHTGDSPVTITSDGGDYTVSTSAQHATWKLRIHTSNSGVYLNKGISPCVRKYDIGTEVDQWYYKITTYDVFNRQCNVYKRLVQMYDNVEELDLNYDERKAIVSCIAIPNINSVNPYQMKIDSTLYTTPELHVTLYAEKEISKTIVNSDYSTQDVYLRVHNNDSTDASRFTCSSGLYPLTLDRNSQFDTVIYLTKYTDERTISNPVISNSETFSYESQTSPLPMTSFTYSRTSYDTDWRTGTISYVNASGHSGQSAWINMKMTMTFTYYISWDDN